MAITKPEEVLALLDLPKILEWAETTDLEFVGKRSNSSACPVATYLIEQGVLHPRVDVGSLNWYTHSGFIGREAVIMPHSMGVLIRKVDARKEDPLDPNISTFNPIRREDFIEDIKAVMEEQK